MHHFKHAATVALLFGSTTSAVQGCTCRPVASVSAMDEQPAGGVICGVHRTACMLGCRMMIAIATMAMSLKTME
jgi:hypothetical protein